MQCLSPKCSVVIKMRELQFGIPLLHTQNKNIGDTRQHHTNLNTSSLNIMVIWSVKAMLSKQRNSTPHKKVCIKVILGLSQHSNDKTIRVSRRSKSHIWTQESTQSLAKMTITNLPLHKHLHLKYSIIIYAIPQVTSNLQFSYLNVKFFCKSGS